MRSKAFVVTKPDRHRFMTAVHGNQIDVDINDEIAFTCSPIDSENLAVLRCAEIDQAVGVLGIVAVIAIGIEVFMDLRAHHPPHLGLRHLSMQRVSDDQMDIVNAMVGEHL